MPNTQGQKGFQSVTSLVSFLSPIKIKILRTNMVKSKYKVSNFLSYLIYAVAIITSGAYLGNLINMGMVHATFWLTLDPVQFLSLIHI